MNAREYVRLAQRALLTEKHLLADLPGIYCTNPADLAGLISQSFKPVATAQVQGVEFQAIRQVVEDYHTKAGTLTDVVRANIARIGSDAPLIRIAHTPDHFAYLGVYAQFIFLDLAAEALVDLSDKAPAQVLLLVDYESVGDKRLRQCYFPDVDYADGAMHLSTPIERSLYYRSQCFIPKPAKSIITDWLRRIDRAIGHNLAVIKRNGIVLKDRNMMRARFEALSRDIWTSYERADYLSEFNAFFMSCILNSAWGIDIAIVPISQITRYMRPVYEYLLSLYPRIVAASQAVVQRLQLEGIDIKSNLLLALDVLPVWYLCPDCHARVKLFMTSQSRLRVRGTCPGCHQDYKFSLGTFNTPNLAPIEDHMAPRVIFDALTDIVGWRMQGGLSYDGSSEHVLVNSLIAKDLGLALPPEGLWRPRGIYFGLAEIRAALELARECPQVQFNKVMRSLARTYWGRASFLYFALAQGIDGLDRMWRDHFRAGKELYEPNVAVDSPFKLSANLRQALENTCRSFESL